MKSSHLQLELLRRWLAGHVDDLDFLHQLLLHLLEECPDCREIWTSAVGVRRGDGLADADFLVLPQRGAWEEAIEEVFEAVVSRLPALHREALGNTAAGETQEILAWLLTLSPAERLRAAAEDPQRLCGPDLALALFTRSREWAPKEPSTAHHWATLALTVARNGARGGAGSRPFELALTYDAETLALAALANAERLMGDLAAAQNLIEEARQRRDEGTGDPLVYAELLSFRASLLRDQGDLLPGERLALKSALLYRRCGEAHQAGRQLLQLAALQGDRQRPGRAAATLRAAMHYLDFELEPHLLAQATENLALCLADDGDPQLALDTLRQHPPLATASRRCRLHRLWTEGRILHSLGEGEAAVEALEQVRQGFTEAGDLPNAAAATLDLALLRCRRGQSEEVLRLAAEALPLLRQMDLRRHAAAALQLLRDAIAARALSAEVLEAVRKAIHRPTPLPHSVWLH